MPWAIWQIVCYGCQAALLPPSSWPGFCDVKHLFLDLLALASTRLKGTTVRRGPGDMVSAQSLCTPSRPQQAPQLLGLLCKTYRVINFEDDFQISEPQILKCYFAYTDFLQNVSREQSLWGICDDTKLALDSRSDQFPCSSVASLFLATNDNC